MSLFVCEQCGGIENTATSRYWFRNSEQLNKGESRALCWDCDPHMKGRRGRFTPYAGEIVLNPEVARNFIVFPNVPDECYHHELPPVEQSHVGGKTLCMGCGSLATTVAPNGATGERGCYDRFADYEWEIATRPVLPALP